MFKPSQQFWPTSRVLQCGLAIALWAAANVLALAGIDLYETAQLADEFDVPTRTIRAYESRRMQIQAGDSQIELGYRFRSPPFWIGRHEVPLLVYLHGSGERGFDNVKQLRSATSVLCNECLADAFPCAVLAPQCPTDLSWSSSIGSDVDMLDVLLRMIDEALRDTRIDPQRV